jgi:branched-chain amino acid transport system permease protein
MLLDPVDIPKNAEPLLTVSGLVKRFGGFQALGGASFDVRPGEVLGLVGPNGSGKTTLINVVSGFYPLTAGSVTVAGVEIGHLPAHEIARRGVARTYQIPRPFVNMTVLENVVLAATFGKDDSSPFIWGGGAVARFSNEVRKRGRDGGVKSDTSDVAYDPSVGVRRRHLPIGMGRKASEIRDEAMHWIGFTGLAGKEDVLPAGLNLHERKFLELARALAARPRLLLLDEVLSGLNPAEVDNAIRLVRAIRAQGATIVFVEHLMRAVVELSDRIAVLNEGKLFALGAPRDVMRDPRVVSIYLGKAYAA